MAYWQILADREVYSNFVLRLHLETIRTPDARETEWTVVDVVDGAAVLPVHDDGSIQMIRQYRHTLGAFFWELPAGRIEPEENPMSAAERELREEAGFDSRELRHLITVVPLAGIVRHRVHVYSAFGLINVPTRREPFEDMESAKFTPQEVRRMILDGEIQCGIALSALHRYFLECEYGARL